jgi:EpsI family protein
MMAGIRFWLMAVLLFSSTVCFHMLRHGEAYALRQPLSTLPAQLAGWRSENLEFPPRIVAAAGVDEYLYREYFAGETPLYLYIGFYKSQRTGDTIHSPKNCMPGAGWQPVSSGHTSLRAPDGRMLPVNLYIIQKGLDRQLVLYWYQAHGRVIASEYWAKIYMVADSIRMNRTDGALVRITSPLVGNQEDARKSAVRFAEELLPHLNEIIPK